MNRLTTGIAAGLSVAALATTAGCGGAELGPEALRARVTAQFEHVVDGDPSTVASAEGLPMVRLRGGYSSTFVNVVRPGEEKLAASLGIEPQYPGSGSISPADILALAEALCVLAAANEALNPESLENIQAADAAIGREFDSSSRAEVNSARTVKINCENALGAPALGE